MVEERSGSKRFRRVMHFPSWSNLYDGDAASPDRHLDPGSAWTPEMVSNKRSLPPIRYRPAEKVQ